MRRIIAGAVLFAFLAIPVSVAQIVIETPVDITGDAAAHPIGTGTARWVQFIVPSANSAAVRIGDANTSATRGLPIAAGGSMLLQSLPPSTVTTGTNQRYNLAAIYCYAAVGDKVSVGWAR